ncbi:MAG: thioredoxin-dependent thiol peroxidase [Deltaproteobacteria bacterium]|nr:thioredoxin-dependent thiol peroxidase [Deltaproteobacteria bacterium]
MLELGTTPAPFTLLDQRGEELTWASLRGAPVVVFFYPKASTPGCTTEACAFRDLSGEFAARGAAVIGVSADTVKRQSGFATKYELNMPLLADTERLVIEPWGVWQEKKNYGKTYMGIVRSTFLFDGEGRLVHLWSPVKVKGHVEAVLARLDELLG